MSESVTNTRLLLGRQLYIFAWAFEICAVLIGLAIAFMQGYASFEEMEEYNTNSGFFTNTNIFIAAMPFLMVALVELTKIPFVGAFYQAKSLVWRIVFGLTLCFMAAITFESAANGFERNFNALIQPFNIYALRGCKKASTIIGFLLILFALRKQYLTNILVINSKRNMFLFLLKFILAIPFDIL